MTQPPANSDEELYNSESFEEATSEEEFEEEDAAEVLTDCSSTGSRSESETDLRNFKMQQHAAYAIKQHANNGFVADYGPSHGFSKRSHFGYSSSSGDEEDVVITETIAEVNNLAMRMDESLSSGRTLRSQSHREDNAATEAATMQYDSDETETDAHYYDDTEVEEEAEEEEGEDDRHAMILATQDAEAEDDDTDVRVFTHMDQTMFYQVHGSGEADCQEDSNEFDLRSRQTEADENDDQMKTQYGRLSKTYVAGMLADESGEEECEENNDYFHKFDHEQLRRGLRQNMPAQFRDYADTDGASETSDMLSNAPTEATSAGQQDNCNAILNDLTKLLFTQQKLEPKLAEELARAIKMQPVMMNLLQNLDGGETPPPKGREPRESSKSDVTTKVASSKHEDGSGDAGRCLRPPSYAHRKYMEISAEELMYATQRNSCAGHSAASNTDSYNEALYKLNEEEDDEEEHTPEMVPNIEYQISSQTPTSFNTDDYALHVNLKHRPSSTDAPRSKNSGRKSFSFSNNQVREIERQNKILLKKMMAIKPTVSNGINKSPTPSKFAALPASTRTTSAAINRKKAQRQIDKDNDLLKRKLEDINKRRRVFK